MDMGYLRINLNTLCMKGLLYCLLVGSCLKAMTQKSSSLIIKPYEQVFDARFVQSPPVFPSGAGSCKRFYSIHFKGVDSILVKAVANGDTAKYLRVYFSFIVDRNGAVYDAHFERVASTRYAKTLGAKTITYFVADGKYYQEAVKQMIGKMPFWKPALQNGIPVSCRMQDFIQFWIGLTPPS